MLISQRIPWSGSTGRIALSRDALGEVGPVARRVIPPREMLHIDGSRSAFLGSLLFSVLSGFTGVKAHFGGCNWGGLRGFFQEMLDHSDHPVRFRKQREVAGIRDHGE